MSLITSPTQQQAIVHAAHVTVVVSCSCGKSGPMLLPHFVSPVTATVTCGACGTIFELVRVSLDSEKGIAQFGVGAKSPKVVIPGGVLQ